MRNTARFTIRGAHRLSRMKSNSDYKQHLPGQQQASMPLAREQDAKSCGIGRDLSCRDPAAGPRKGSERAMREHGGGSALAAESGRHQASHALLLLQLREKHWELLQLLGGGSRSRPARSQELPSEEGQGKARALSASVSCRKGLWQKETSPQSSQSPGRESTLAAQMAGSAGTRLSAITGK
ncbi:unnamed protein product [Rangifer tarandus platyrhynchus]|uniref:Uncharacterized protein n=2 Tax=Rangifer tarandus platyrhynchus TaxID=3082113 RepID=A0ABN8YZA3_RANTA|nr:unnamed protein product [Rangifer tarandus platyrhynchus]CAI9705297.1 unnamed protein product [Rangifer tarandus platyrhynchus]